MSFSCIVCIFEAHFFSIYDPLEAECWCGSLYVCCFGFSIRSLACLNPQKGRFRLKCEQILKNWTFFASLGSIFSESMVLLTTIKGNEVSAMMYNPNHYNIVLKSTFMDNKSSIWGSLGGFLSSKRVKFGRNADIMENREGSYVF